MSQNDLRVRRTHKFLRQAFMDLLTEKGFETLTVQDIVDRAMVNRSTFYRHYQDKYHLVSRLVDEMLDELLRQVAPPPSTSELLALDKPPDAWVLLFKSVAMNQALYRLVFTQTGTEIGKKRFQSMIEELIRQRIQLLARDTAIRIPFEVIVGYCSAAVLGSLAWWLANGTPYTPEIMAAWVQQLLVLGPYYGLGIDLQGVVKD